MKLTKARKAELVMETMRWLAELGRPYIVSDVLYVGPTRALVKAGELEAFRDRAGQWCVALPAVDTFRPVYCEVPIDIGDAERVVITKIEINGEETG